MFHFKMRFNIPLIFIIFRLTLAQGSKECASTCSECFGAEYCAVNNVDGCLQGDIPCTDPCLSQEIRSQFCFDSSLSGETTCDPQCNFCIRDYQCNLAMEEFGLCTSAGVVDCLRQAPCLDGPAKKLCAVHENKGQCRADCDTCTFSDDCVATGNTTQCMNHNVKCEEADQCLDNAVRIDRCFKSKVPGNGTCSADLCETCIDQFECNVVLQNAGYCRNETVHCLEQGSCLTDEVRKTCGVVPNSIGNCGCGGCFENVNCTEGSLQLDFGACLDGKLACTGAGACVIRDVFNDQCQNFGFCTLNKGAPVWVKARCFVIGIVFVILVCLVFYAVFKCITTPPTIEVYHK